MSGGSYEKSDVVLNLLSWSLPDTAKVSVSFNTSLHSVIDNSCTKNLRFTIDKYDNFTYRVYARALYENHGELCNDILVYKDTTLSIKLDYVGKYYFYFLKGGVFKKDSIIIIH
jgi:hypothetical protein